MNPSSVRSAAKPLYRQAQGAIIGTIARTVSPASIWIMNREDRAAECGGVMEPIHLIGVQADRAGSKTMRIRSLRNKQRQKGVYEGLHYTHK